MRTAVRRSVPAAPGRGLRTQVTGLLCHLVVLLHGLSLLPDVLAAVLLQKVLGLLPESVALGAQFQNLTHSVCPP